MKQTTAVRFAPALVLACSALLLGAPHAVGEPKPAKTAAAKSKTADKKTQPASGRRASHKRAVAAKRRAASGKSSGNSGAKPAPAVPGRAPFPPARPDQARTASVAPSAAPTGPGRILAAAVPMLITPALGAPNEFAPVERPSARTTPLSYAPGAPPSEADIDAVRQGLELARRGKTEAATERRDQIRDAAGQKLVEWMILRSDGGGVGFSRYAAFARANPAWPSAGMIRRRAESQLWNEKREAGTVLAFFAEQPPVSGRGKLAMARALLSRGDRAGAQKYVRDAWRNDDFSAELETQALEDFGPFITRADHKARMDIRLYDGDHDTALRAAKRLDATQAAIVQARVAVDRKARNAGALLQAVPNDAHTDASYMFGRIQWLRRQDRIGEAAQLMLAAPRDPEAVRNADEWWVERRLIARKLLDADNPQAAYRVVRDAATPRKDNYHVDQLFTAGWIALRFLNDPITAGRHFAAIAQADEHPTSRARGLYWQGRAAEAAGRSAEARRHYEAAAQHTAAYYGQLACARLGRSQIAVRKPPALSASERAALRNLDLVRALELLYATGNRDLAIPFVADLERVNDIGALTMLAETTAKHNDPRAMLYVGKTALAGGFAFDHYAFPAIGLPKYSAIGPEAERSLVYSIARQESAFNPRVVSSARAMGLMQVTPAAGRYIARKYGVAFHEKKLLTDPVYNMQFGAAEIGALVQDYDGNHALAFAAYNAGRGRVKEWIGRFGDPRDPKVDPVDWVERIPFTETRNYVQRVMENMQVYRARFGADARLGIEADMRGARQ